jgi:DNA polymerase (family 10)
VIALLRVPAWESASASWQARPADPDPRPALQAAKDGRIRILPGFGAKTEQKIIDSVQAHLGETRRFKLSDSAQYGEALAQACAVPGVKQCRS